MPVKLTAALEAAIVEARYLVNRDGCTVEEAARLVGLPLLSTKRAVAGKTWLNVGGPLPSGVDRPKWSKRQRGKNCRHCQMLTDHHSGYCQFCRAEHCFLIL